MSVVAADRRHHELNSDATAAIFRNSSQLCCTESLADIWSVMVYGGVLPGTELGMRPVLLCTAAWTGGAGCEGQLACSLA